MRISVIFGTRPEAIKLAPVILALRRTPGIDCRVCVTGQHRQMLDQVLEVFAIKPDVDLNLMEPNQTLARLTARAIEAIDGYLTTDRPDLVLVQGDTTTVFCAALAAFYHKIPVGHVEAGLRTGNLQAPWPEEANRVLLFAKRGIHLTQVPPNWLWIRCRFSHFYPDKFTILARAVRSLASNGYPVFAIGACALAAAIRDHDLVFAYLPWFCFGITAYSLVTDQIGLRWYWLITGVLLADTFSVHELYCSVSLLTTSALISFVRIPIGKTLEVFRRHFLLNLSLTPSDRSNAHQSERALPTHLCRKITNPDTRDWRDNPSLRLFVLFRRKTLDETRGENSLWCPFPHDQTMTGKFLSRSNYL